MNEYEGYRPQLGEPLAEIYKHPQSYEHFYNTYVATRRPVIIRQITQHPHWSRLQLWNSKYLSQLVGDVTVEAECRRSDNDRFGGSRDTVIETSFQKLLDAKNANLYLTSQCYQEEAMDRIYQDIPQIPCFLQGLIPESCNLWMGHCSKGSSSGLHHDFHDNLYVLARGKKRFRLFSPANALDIPVRGTIAHVHPNGLINYAERPASREDGAEIRHARAVEHQIMLEQQDDADPEELDLAIDAVLEAELDLVTEDECEPLSFCTGDIEGGWICELNAGDALYLPASWFHEVTSWSEEEQVHVAVNMWFHPPNTGSSSQSPYQSCYWSYLNSY